jgi:CBS domain-containing protein
MLVREILVHKGRKIHSCTPDHTLAEVVDLLVKHNCGSLLVCKHDEMVGIITERDILRAVAETRCELENMCVADRMTPAPVTANSEDDIGDAMGLMTAQRIRHLPVMDGSDLVGIISIGDLVKAQHAELCRENEYLKTYIQS